MLETTHAPGIAIFFLIDCHSGLDQNDNYFLIRVTIISWSEWQSFLRCGQQLREAQALVALDKQYHIWWLLPHLPHHNLHHHHQHHYYQLSQLWSLGWLLLYRTNIILILVLSHRWSPWMPDGGALKVHLLTITKRISALCASARRIIDHQYHIW